MPKVYEKIATLVQARANCIKSGNAEWKLKHEETADNIAREYLPSGSGYDSGTKIDWDKSTVDKLVFLTAFHHMDDNGFYCGWSHHSVIVTPSLAWRFNARITGRDMRNIKEHMQSEFDYQLNADLPAE